MKKHASRLAGVVVGFAMGAGAAFAGDAEKAVSYEGTCLAPIKAYQSGLPAMAGADAMTAEQKLIKLTADFRTAMSAFREVQTCHQDLFAASGASEEFASLYAGTRETSRVFSLVQTQFEASVEEMSAQALDSVEPAAGNGAEADLAGEAAMLTTMEILMDSYMALERSQEFGKSLVKMPS
jgi:hypothetical protein